MKLSSSNLSTLLHFLHQKIEENAAYVSEALFLGDKKDFLTYPPDVELSQEELLAFDKFKADPNLRSALKKLLADNSAGVLFELFNLIDGTIDPDEELGEWTEICLVDKTHDFEENIEMLHDSLYASYWDWHANQSEME